MLFDSEIGCNKNLFLFSMSFKIITRKRPKVAALKPTCCRLGLSQQNNRLFSLVAKQNNRLFSIVTHQTPPLFIDLILIIAYNLVCYK